MKDLNSIKGLYGKNVHYGVECFFYRINVLGTMFNAIASIEPEKEHVSVSTVKGWHMPTYNQMCAIKDMFFGEEDECYQVFPRKIDYVNMYEVWHLWKLRDQSIALAERL